MQSLSKRLAVFILVIVGLLVTWALFSRWGESASRFPAPSSVSGMNESQGDDFIDQNLETLGTLLVPGKVEISRAKMPDAISKAQDRIEYEVRLEGGTGRGLLQLDGPTGQLRKYIAPSDFAEKPDSRGNARDDVLTGKEAFERAAPILEYLGLAAVMSEYDLYLDNQSEEVDIANNVWWLEKRFVHNDIPVRGSAITIVIGAYSGQLLLVEYRPPVIPSQLDIAVTAERAIGEASTWFATDRHFKEAAFNVLEGQEPDLIVGMVKGFRGVLVLQDTDALSDSYYCWEIAAVSRTEGRANLWVRVDDGSAVAVHPIP